VNVLLALLALGCGKSDDSAACQGTQFWLDEDGDGYGDLGSPVDAVHPAGECGADARRLRRRRREACTRCGRRSATARTSDCDGTGDARRPPGTRTRTGDGYGDADAGTKACEQPDGMIADGTDCDDGDARCIPGAVEECDGDDDDCDGRDDVGAVGTGTPDEDGGRLRRRRDVDEDLRSRSHVGGRRPGLRAAIDTVHPGAVEICNAYDDDCDGDTLACGYSGDHDLGRRRRRSSSGIRATTPADSSRAADFDGDGDQDIVVPTLYANHYGGRGYIVDGSAAARRVRARGVRSHDHGWRRHDGGRRSIGVATRTTTASTTWASALRGWAATTCS
jgi:hypothetical protein